jgi:hypothetical protein
MDRQQIDIQSNIQSEKQATKSTSKSTLAKSRHWLKSIGLVLLVLVTIVLGAIYVYTIDYHRSTSMAQQAMKSDDQVEVRKQGDLTLFRPLANHELAQTGLIFYPGGKVEDQAYAPLLHKLAARGLTVVLVRMPFTLAVLDVGAASKAMASQPTITDWYIGGHSLGGAMAATYSASHASQLKGLILLAAYSASDLKNTNLAVLSVWGSNDQILNLASLVAGRALLPPKTLEYQIAGGNHENFGNYGRQKGDGQATISAETQQALTVDQIIDFIHFAATAKG